MGKKILVTGGAGFIGSHLCERLLKAGHEIFCLDNLCTGSQSNISTMMNEPRFHFLLHDVTVPFDLVVDEIYNLACPASLVYYQADPVKTMQTNILGAMNVLGLARQTGARVLQASTSEVYGDPLVHPQAEDYWGNVNPIGIRSCYDEGKRCAETLFFDYHRHFGVDIRVIRIFNTYGPHMLADDGRVISNFIMQALQGKDITVYGDGKQSRSFCYVDDMITAIIKMMAQEEFIGPVNLGNAHEFTILELVEIILRLTHSKSNIIFKPLPQDDPKMRQPALELAESKLDWQAQVQLEDGLQSCIAYFRSLYIE